MRAIYTLFILMFILSCSTTMQEKKGMKEAEQVTIVDSLSSDAEKESAPEQIQRKTYPKEPITSINNTSWINSPFLNCTDTLKFLKGDGIYYMCEHDDEYTIQFEVSSDTVYVDLYALKSELNPDEGTIIKSKYKFIKSDGSLIMVYAAHKYRDFYESVDGKDRYKEFEKL